MQRKTGYCNKQIDPLIGTMAGRKNAPEYDKQGYRLTGKQLQMPQQNTQDSNDGACCNRASIVNHSYAIIGPFMGLEFDCCGYQSGIKVLRNYL